MNKAEILNIILVIAVVFLSVKIAFFSNKSAKAGDAAYSEDAVMENIMTRTAPMKIDKSKMRRWRKCSKQQTPHIASHIEEQRP